MKMQANERASLVKSFGDAMRANVSQTVVKGSRKSGDDPDRSRDEPVSFTKYLKGAILGNWREADGEQEIFKALGRDSATAGGFFVPPQLSDEVIERLKATAVVRSMPGVRVVPMTRTDKLQINRVTGAPAVTWSGEAATLSEDTGLTFGQVTLELKKATVLYKLSRELLEEAGPEVDNLVRTEIAEQLAIEEDKVFLRGTGGLQPLGFLYHPGVLNTDLSARVGGDNIRDAIYQVRAQNSEITGFVADPVALAHLADEKDSNGRFIINENGNLGSPGTSVQGVMRLLNIPVKSTTQIGTGDYPGSTETFIVGGKWSDMLIGERPGLRIDTSEHVYFANDQIGLRIVKQVGMALRHPEAFVVIKGITGTA
ncbi:MAG TPA: phage major capsid protein [Phycisphaerae bacterium]|nr:phage major capsid protein [Phycisphaerae bacterium]